MNKFLSDSDIDDSQFQKVLNFKDLVEKYIKEKKELFSQIDDKHEKNREDEIEKKLRGIDQDLKHRMVLNSCIFPCLADNGKLAEFGYQFIRASPLYEKKVANLDFLLFHPEPPVVAIFGEAKGDASDPGAVIDQTRERIRLFKII